VAKKITSAKTKSTAKAEAKFRLYYPVLAECELERASRPEGTSEDKEPERFYDCTLEMSETGTNMSVAVCEFSAGQKIEETKILEIRATYFIGLRIAELKTEAEKKSALRELVSAAAWPMFRDLFIHIGSQSGEELPLLPSSPKLRWIGDK
jgi:hypothetical protein